MSSLLVQWIPALALTLVCAAVLAGLALLGKQVAGATTLTGKWMARGLIVAQSIVHDLEATMVPELRELSADGSLSKEDIAKLRADAWKRFTDSLGTAGMDGLQKELGVTVAGLQGVVMGWIEGLVSKLSSNAPTPITLTAVAPATPGAPGAALVASVGAVPPAPLRSPLTPR